MGKPFLEQINCPVCDTLQTSITWSEIDAQADHGARDALFAGELNAFDCRACGYAGQIVTALLYQDRLRRFCVQYYPEEMLDDDEWLAQTAAEKPRADLAALPEVVRERSAYLLHPHVVFDLDEMLRFIVFREKLWELQHPGDE